MAIAARSQPPESSGPSRLGPSFLFPPLIGRDQEIARLLAWLIQPEFRLVTITGPGGVGKTSLAVQVAQASAQNFSDGAFFISLAALDDPTLVFPTIAEALGLPESPDRLPFDSLKDFLRKRQTLLLLDNFEQLISAAPLLSELLSAGEGLKLLVTSRESLRLRGEREFPLAPLELSEDAPLEKSRSIEAWMGYASIALFVQRAQANQPDFRLTAENAAAVAEICARLDGLPLAIELAAARMKLLPPQSMLERLKSSPLQLLNAGARDAPARQKTLRDTVQWSYDLLKEDEKRVFRTLSAFTGGFAIEAAETLLEKTGSPIKDSATQSQVSSLDFFNSLVDKNLIRRMSADSTPRLGILETIREFGLEQLALEKELEPVQRAHAEYFLTLAEGTEPMLAGREQKAWLERLEREQDNFRAALRWGSESPSEDQRGDYLLRLVSALWQFWFLRGHWSEGRRWLEEAISISSSVETDKALRAKALHVGVPMFVYHGDLDRARSLCEQSVSLYQELKDPVGLLAALLQLCRTLDYQGEEELSMARANEALALAEALPDSPVKAQAYQELSRFAYSGSWIEKGAALQYLEESVRMYRSMDNPVGLANALFMYAELLGRQGDTERAQVFFNEAEGLAAEVDDHRMRMVLLGHYLINYYLQRKYNLARHEFELLFAHQASAATSKFFLEVLAAILNGQGLSIWSARVFGLAENAARHGPRKRVTEPISGQLAVVRAEVRDRLGEGAFAKALVEGASLKVDDLLAIPHPSPQDSNVQPNSSLFIEPLTSRELEVLRLLPLELSNPQIAERLVVSRRTVDAHLRSIYGKLGVRSRDAAVRVAREKKILADDPFDK